MLNSEFFNRNQYIQASNELNKKTDTKLYVNGNRQKVELDKKLEELSIQNGVLVSGNLVRQNILNSSASKATSIPNVVDTEVIVAEREQNKNGDNPAYVSPSYEKYINSTINQGKNIANAIKNDDSKRSFEMDKFNSNKNSI